MSSNISDEWSFVHTLGEGAFGEVKLLVNKKSNILIAAKVIQIDKHKQCEQNIQKEVSIHRLLNHENVIKFYGHQKDELTQYIFLEYASGGELFDRIEPDVGMSSLEAFSYFSQLINGVSYLHKLGIAHRDLKPENLLLTEDNVLKISDFGMSTLFRYQGKTRLMTNKCGTFLYMAPEVYENKPYQAEPADIWSCGIILAAMLTGQLPWDEPSMECLDFKKWINSDYLRLPWSKLDNLTLSLFIKILNINIKKRFRIEDIISHSWYKKLLNRSQSPNQWLSPKLSRKRACTNSPKGPISQPILPHTRPDLNMNTYSQQSDNIISFSQPLYPENMIVNTQLQNTQTQTSHHLNPYQKLVKRMTRFFVRNDLKETFNNLTEILEREGYSWQKCASGSLTISSNDKRQMMLVFKANLINISKEQILVDFRLSRGDGIEFKRHFLRIKQHLDYRV